MRRREGLKGGGREGVDRKNRKERTYRRNTGISERRRKGGGGLEYTRTGWRGRGRRHRRRHQH